MKKDADTTRPATGGRTVRGAGILVLLITAGAWTLPEQSGPDLTDPQVAHVAVTANRIDVEAARLALEKSSTRNVRTFAEAMIADHENVIEQAGALAGRLGVTPEDNAVSGSLEEGWEARRTELRTLEGEAFDQAYMEGEVAYHEAVIDAVRGILVPTTENAELRELLENVLPALEGHLSHAQRVVEGL